MNNQEYNKTLYKSCDVWRRKDGQVFRYRCFQNIQTGKFYVQSLDCYHKPEKDDIYIDHENKFFELLFEEDPGTRSTGHSTLEEAIDAFDRDFM